MFVFFRQNTSKQKEIINIIKKEEGKRDKGKIGEGGDTKACLLRGSILKIIGLLMEVVNNCVETFVQT